MRRDKRRNAEIKEIEKYRNEEMHAAMHRNSKEHGQRQEWRQRERERDI